MKEKSTDNLPDRTAAVPSIVTKPRKGVSSEPVPREVVLLYLLVSCLCEVKGHIKAKMAVTLKYSCGFFSRKPSVNRVEFFDYSVRGKAIHLVKFL